VTEVTEKPNPDAEKSESRKNLPGRDFQLAVYRLG